MRLAAFALFVWLGLGLLPPAAAAQTEVFSNPAFVPVDVDSFMRERALPWMRRGPNFFTPLDPVVVTGVLKRPPFRWPAGDRYYAVATRFNRIAEPPPARYGLAVTTRAGRTVIFHLQDRTAASILAEIARDGAGCCVGRPVRVWARSAYIAEDGRHGFLAIGVVTDAR